MANSMQEALFEAKVLIQNDQPQQADSILATLLKEDKNNFEALYLRGVCALALQQRPLAIAHMRRCIRINPSHFEATHSLGLLALQDSKPALALEYLLRAYEINPSNTELLGLIGRAHFKNNDYHNAITTLEMALKSSPSDYQVLFHLSLSYGALLDYNNALFYTEKCLEYSPTDTKILFLASMLRRDRGESDCARGLLQTLLEIDPDHVEAHFELSQILLAEKKYQAGFSEYEWRLKRPNAPKVNFSQNPLPTSLQGVHFHLVAEQGAGDAIHFARYLKFAYQHGARLSLSCHPALVTLFSTLEYIEKIIAFGTPYPEAEYIIPLMSLPHLLHLNETEITGGVPYLDKIASRPLPIVPGKENALKIGLVWSGSSAFANNARRACPFSYFNQFSQLENIVFYNFQIGEFCEDSQNWQGQAPLIDLSSHINSYLDTAAYLQDIDILIATDTSTPHLAGSLGKPVYLMVNKIPDWRWVGGQSTSQWYPSFTLFHQQTEGDWAYVLNSICDKLNSQ